MAVPLTYGERNAVDTLRKAIRKKPEIIAELFKDAPYEAATAALVGIKKELDVMLAVTRAFQRAAGELAKLQKENQS